MCILILYIYFVYELEHNILLKNTIKQSKLKIYTVITYVQHSVFQSDSRLKSCLVLKSSAVNGVVVAAPDLSFGSLCGVVTRWIPYIEKKFLSVGVRMFSKSLKLCVSIKVLPTRQSPIGSS